MPSFQGLFLEASGPELCLTPLSVLLQPVWQQTLWAPPSGQIQRWSARQHFCLHHRGPDLRCLLLGLPSASSRSPGASLAAEDPHGRVTFPPLLGSGWPVAFHLLRVKAPNGATSSNGLNVCGPPNPYVEPLPLSVVALGGGALGRRLGSAGGWF